MLSPAIITGPNPYSEVCDTFRPRLGQRATRRADLGGELFIDFFKSCPVPNGFVLKHISKRRPACIKYRLSHSGFGKSGGIHVAHRDIVKLPYDAIRELVKKIFPGVGGLGVKLLRQFFLSCPLRDGESLGVPKKMSGILNSFSGGKDCEFFEAQIYTDFLDGPLQGFFRNINHNIDIPVPPRVLGKACPVFDLAIWQFPGVENSKNISSELKVNSVSLKIATFKGDPSEGFFSPVTQPWSSLLRSSLGILFANCVDCPGMNAQIFTGSGRKFIEVEPGRPLFAPFKCVLLRVVAKIPNVIARSGLFVQQAIKGLDAIFVNEYHDTYSTWSKMECQDGN